VLAFVTPLPGYATKFLYLFTRQIDPTGFVEHQVAGGRGQPYGNRAGAAPAGAVQHVQGDLMRYSDDSLLWQAAQHQVQGRVRPRERRAVRGWIALQGHQATSTRSRIGPGGQNVATARERARILHGLCRLLHRGAIQRVRECRDVREHRPQAAGGERTRHSEDVAAPAFGFRPWEDPVAVRGHEARPVSHAGARLERPNHGCRVGYPIQYPPTSDLPRPQHGGMTIEDGVQPPQALRREIVAQTVPRLRLSGQRRVYKQQEAQTIRRVEQWLRRHVTGEEQGIQPQSMRSTHLSVGRLLRRDASSLRVEAAAGRRAHFQRPAVQQVAGLLRAKAARPDAADEMVGRTPVRRAFGSQVDSHAAEGRRLRRPGRQRCRGVQREGGVRFPAPGHVQRHRLGLTKVPTGLIEKARRQPHSARRPDVPHPHAHDDLAGTGIALGKRTRQVDSGQPEQSHAAKDPAVRRTRRKPHACPLDGGRLVSSRWVAREGHAD